MLHNTTGRDLVSFVNQTIVEIYGSSQKLRKRAQYVGYNPQGYNPVNYQRHYHWAQSR